MGLANNVVMQEKIDKMAVENAWIQQAMVADQPVAAKYHHVIDTTMSMT